MIQVLLVNHNVKRTVLLCVIGLMVAIVGCESKDDIKKREQERISAFEDSVQIAMLQKAEMVASSFLGLYLEDEDGVNDTLWSMLSTKSTKSLPRESMRGIGFVLNKLLWQRTHGMMDYSKGYKKPSDTAQSYDTAWIDIDSGTFVADTKDTTIRIWYTVSLKWSGLRVDPRINFLPVHAKNNSYKIFVGEANKWQGP